MKTIKIVISTALFLAVSFSQVKTPVVKERQIKQHNKIEQGIKNGELTRREATTLKKQQLEIQKHKIEAKSDGIVTPIEKKKLDKEQNRAAKNIYIKKHNKRDRN